MKLLCDTDLLFVFAKVESLDLIQKALGNRERKHTSSKVEKSVKKVKQAQIFSESIIRERKRTFFEKTIYPDRQGNSKPFLLNSVEAVTRGSIEEANLPKNVQLSLEQPFFEFLKNNLVFSLMFW